jgi:hypothetical protein
LYIEESAFVGTNKDTLFHLHRQVRVKNTYPPMKMEQSVPKRRHINFRRRGITQKKAYNEGEIVGECSTYAGLRKPRKILLGEAEGKRRLAISSGRWDSGAKRGYNGVDCLQVAHGTEQKSHFTHYASQ